MPEYVAPGVYVEEVPSGARPIPRVPTSVAGFVGELDQGPLLQAVEVDGVPDLIAGFGPSAAGTPVGESLAAFFANGGRRAFVVRVESARMPGEGLAVLDGVRDVAIQIVPDTATLDEAAAVPVIQAVVDRAEQSGRFYLMDPPAVDVAAWIDAHPGLRSPDVAVFVPRLVTEDDTVSAGGAVAGIYARTDRERGVWKAPAGLEAVIHGALLLDRTLSDAEIEQLTEEGINPLRAAPGGDLVVWGGRTLSSDPEWKYVSVRRMALFLEHSIQRGTGWAVFEPNGEALWRMLRRSVEEFLSELFHDGAFQGASPSEAYLVRCDRNTMTQVDIDAGRVIIQVGFAPLRPAEFVVMSITLTGVGSLHEQVTAPLQFVIKTASIHGVSAAPPVLFSGASAQQAFAGVDYLAHATGTKVLGVDLSRVVSKYIGETEKNLDSIVHLAEKHRAILFFDEADALFGRHSGLEDRRQADRVWKAISSYSGLVVFVSTGAPRLAARTVAESLDEQPVVCRFPD